MRTLSASEAKGQFGEIMAARETVVITRYGKPAKAVVDYDWLQEVQAAEDRYWLEESRKGEESGFLGPEESERLLKEWMKAED